MASLTDKFSKAVQKKAVAPKAPAPVVSRPPTPVKAPAAIKAPVVTGKRALAAPSGTGEARATSLLDNFRRAAVVPLSMALPPVGAALGARGAYNQYKRTAPAPVQQNLGAAERLGSNILTGAAGGIAGALGREYRRFERQGPVAAVTLPFRAVGSAAKFAQTELLQPFFRGATTLAGAPLQGLGVPMGTITPRGPAQRFLLGNEPLAPAAQQIAQTTEDAQSLGFTPGFATKFAPFGVLGGAALDAIPDASDLAKGVVKKGVREGAQEALERGVREEAETIAERGVREGTETLVEGAGDRIARKLRQQVDGVTIPDKKLRPNPPRVVKTADDVVARTVDNLVERGGRELTEEQVTALARSIGSRVDEVARRLDIPTEEAATRVLDEIEPIVPSAPARSPEVPQRKAPVEALKLSPGSPRAPVVARPGTPIAPTPKPAAPRAPEVTAPVFERTLKSGAVPQPIRKGGKVVTTEPAALLRGEKIATPPSGPKNTVTPGKSALDEAVRIVTTKKPTASKRERLGDFVSNVRTSLIQEYFPIQRAERKLSKGVGRPVPEIDVAKRFEFQAGAQGKAEKDLIDFSGSVVDNIKDLPNEFNTYLFLKRTASRLAADPNVKKVGSWTPEKVGQALEELRLSLGDEAFARVEATANGPYQDAMNRALELQVQTGRMSEDVYRAIKESNDFYAPFKILKYLDEGGDFSGAGKNLASGSPLTKKITGIQDDDFAVGDILQESARQIYRSRILAEKQLRMQSLQALADIDPSGQFFRRVDAGANPRPGYEVLTYLDNGKRTGLEVKKDIARAVASYNPAQMDLVQKALSASRSLLRGGATTFNLGFQPVNLFFADLPSTALFSRYGIRSPKDLVQFPVDFAGALLSSIKSNFGTPTELYKDWLASGAANSTIQRELTPGAFERRFALPPKGARQQVTRAAQNALDTVPKIANAIEEAGKLVGFKRGLRAEGINMRDIEKLSPGEQERALERLVAEVRNYSGSPDFARSGSAREMNLLFMFFNARIQGAARDFKRLAGVTGGKEAGDAWFRLSTAVGVPAAALMLYNLMPENYDDFQKIPDYEKQNYFMIPRAKTFTDEATGEEVREYWRIPKREIVKLFSNMIESALTSVATKDPEALKNFSMSFLENILPINIEGENLLERGQSLIGSMNPLLKVPIEQITNTNTFRKAPLVASKYESPADRTLEYTESTPPVVKGLAETAAKIFGKDSIFASPLRLQSILEGFTAGGLTQFLPKEAEAGRSPLTALPIISRFMRSGSVNENDFWAAYNESAGRQKTERRETALGIQEDIETMKTLDGAGRKQFLLERVQADPEYLGRLSESLVKQGQGWTSRDQAIANLGVANGERARFIGYLLREADSNEARKELLLDLSNKKVLTEDVLSQLAEELAKPVVE